MNPRGRTRDHIDQIYQEVLRMGALVEDSLRRGLTAVRNHDPALARAVVEQTHAIHRQRTLIEDHCVTTIATQQALGPELRELIGIIKGLADLERIGDHGKHLAAAVHRVSEPALARLVPYIEPMGELGIRMVREALTALRNHDARQAQAIADLDRDMDAMNRDFQGTIVALMKERPDFVEDGVTLIFLSRFLERLGDHAIRICQGIEAPPEGGRIGVSP